MSARCITADGVCDLPKALLSGLAAELTRFYIDTDGGCFQDTVEVDARSILDYMAAGSICGRIGPPSVYEYRQFFSRKLEDCNEVLHLSAGSRLSVAWANACQAAEKVSFAGRRVHVFDTGQFSSGMGLMVLRGIELDRAQVSTPALLEALEDYGGSVRSSFIVKSPEALLQAGKVRPGLVRLCAALSLHPVLTLRDGALRLKGLERGPFDRAVLRFVKKQAGALREQAGAAPRLILTHAGCSPETVEAARAMAVRRLPGAKPQVAEASAAISGCCGPEAFGVFSAPGRAQPAPL